MTTYHVKYYKKNIMIENAKPYGPYDFGVISNTLENAIIEAVVELCKIGYTSGYNDVYNARIIDPEDKSHEILRESNWLVDFKTGKKLSNLEKKAI